MTTQTISVGIDTCDSQFLKAYIIFNNIRDFDGSLFTVNKAVASIIHNFILQEREKEKDDSV